MHPYQIGPALHTFNWDNISSATHIKWDKWKDDRERKKRKAIALQRVCRQTKEDNYIAKWNSQWQELLNYMFKAKITCHLASRKVG